MAVTHISHSLAEPRVTPHWEKHCPTEVFSQPSTSRCMARMLQEPGKGGNKFTQQTFRETRNYKETTSLINVVCYEAHMLSEEVRTPKQSPVP